VKNIQGISPRIVERRGGGWLAISPSSYDLMIGVVADTEEAARVKFHAAVAEWRLMLNSAREAQSCPRQMTNEPSATLSGFATR